MNIIIFGPPGIGKGSTSVRLSKRLNVPHIATGDILREEAKKPNNKLKQFMDKGLLVPDSLVSETILKKIQSKECKRGFILDGFPRTTNQAEFLEKNKIRLDNVTNLEADEDVIVTRLAGRLICPKDNTIYHTKNIPPKKKGVCDKCGSKLVKRKDDIPSVIKKRIKVYLKDTKPILDFYSKKGIVKNIDGSKSLEEVLEDIAAVLK